MVKKKQEAGSDWLSNAFTYETQKVSLIFSSAIRAVCCTKHAMFTCETPCGSGCAAWSASTASWHASRLVIEERPGASSHLVGLRGPFSRKEGG